MFPQRIWMVLPALALVLGAALSAPARDMRLPQKGIPAYVFVLPDDWTDQPDNSGNLIMRSANRTTCLVILLQESAEDLDEVAKVAFETAKVAPAQRKEPAEISGCKGHTYFSTLTNDTGVHTNLEMTIVRVDGKHIAAATLILAEGVAKADETSARLVRNGLKLQTEE